ncbi:AdeJ family multidrug efflux RND transporter permease subunit [Acinetobacter baumannii]|nr:AdeJ family multidrug efflux RND transporter permease subunit [Acinetobacter baumannii]
MAHNAMRIWLDPAKLTSYQLTPSDIATALQAQNSQVAVGQLGGAPAVQGQVLKRNSKCTKAYCRLLNSLKISS